MPRLMQPCPACGGEGGDVYPTTGPGSWLDGTMYDEFVACRECDGTGEVEVEEDDEDA